MPKTIDVVWLNGSFGVGKTTVADELKSLIVGSVVFNPELIGSLLRFTLPSLPEDYQDLALWRKSVRLLVGELARARDDPVIVPMTITNERYFDEIVGGLRADGHRIAHYTLTASPDTIRARMSSRADPTPWGFAQIDRCIAAFNGSERFREYVKTDDLSPQLAAERIRRLALDTGAGE